MENNVKEMVKIAYAALDDKKAINPSIIDISKISVLADYFIIASGNNENQVQAMADNVVEALEKAGYPCRQSEGYRSANWILLDFNDIVIHIFNHEDRLFYDLERIWRDGEKIEIEQI
jgi:ribosome-associated protein